MSTILTIKTGASSASPLPSEVMETFDSAEITQTDDGPSGFQLTFKVGRNKSTGLQDYQALVSGVFELFNRTIIYISLDGKKYVLMDGIITHHQLNPSPKPGMSTMTITGEDLSVLMDLHEISEHYPNQGESTIARAIIDKYSSYKLDPMVTKPESEQAPLKVNMVPAQRETDLQYLKRMASRYAYDFYIIPGPEPGSSKAYWGPKQRRGEKQPAISVNMKQGSNTDTVNFGFNGLSPTRVADKLQTRGDDKKVDIKTRESEVDPLSKKPALDTAKKWRESLIALNPGLDHAQALRQAQAQVDQSVMEASTATGHVNGFRYRGVLQARGLVGLRGAGETFDGLYYVKSVTHTLRRGEYTQSFTLNREGASSTTNQVQE